MRRAHQTNADQQSEEPGMTKIPGRIRWRADGGSLMMRGVMPASALIEPWEVLSLNRISMAPVLLQPKALDCSAITPAIGVFKGENNLKLQRR